jgi:glycerol kinase
MVIYENVKDCLDKVCQRNDLDASKVKAVGITNQRETTVAFDRNTGKPLFNAIVWLDQRTVGVVSQIKEQKAAELEKITEVCGLPVNTYFSGVKMKWLLQNVEAV